MTIFEIAATVFKYGLGATIGLFTLIVVWGLALSILSGIAKVISGGSNG